MCDQQRLRSSCAYAQSDQSFCLSLEYSMSVKLLTEHHLEFLSFKGGCTGSPESTHVKMVHCVKSRALAHVLLYIYTLDTGLCSLKRSTPDSDGWMCSKTTVTVRAECFPMDAHVITVVPTKSDSDVIFCLQLSSKTLTCTLY